MSLKFSKRFCEGFLKVPLNCFTSFVVCFLKKNIMTDNDFLVFGLLLLLQQRDGGYVMLTYQIYQDPLVDSVWYG